jgi:hypothetical protein
MSDTIPQIILTFKPEISIIEDAEKGLILKPPTSNLTSTNSPPELSPRLKLFLPQAQPKKP